MFFSHNKSASATNSIFLSQQIGTGHQPQPTEQSKHEQIVLKTVPTTQIEFSSNQAKKVSKVYELSLT